MSAATAPPAHVSRTGKGTNFGRAIHSEWIKLRTVPSTVILLSITLVVMVGLAVLSGWGLAVSAGFQGGMPPEQQAQMAESGVQGLQGAAYTVPAGGIIFGQLLIASLAVVLIASEWGTGMIRSTMVAVPKRIPALLAKNLVIAAVSFVIGVIAALISYYVAQPFLAGEDLDFAITHDGILASIVNTGTYLALIAIISMAIGTLLRNTAGGIVTAVGLFFVLPVIVVNILAGLADWIPEAARFLPTNAGQQLVAIEIADDALNQWQGGLVMAAWAVGLLVISLIVAKRRDV
ncbi:MAG TPA: ABC transporter permease subunit [Arthrobacter sp.]|nr:ABC transporter permease subunit [Arthrobacter sp.]